MSQRTIKSRLLIDWSKQLNYTDETPYLISASGSWNLVPPGLTLVGSAGQPAQMNLLLDNSDGRYSAYNTSSPLYTYLNDNACYHAPVTFEVSTGGAFVRVFTGVIKIPREEAGSRNRPAQVTLACRGREEAVRGYKTSTLLSDFEADHGQTEAERIKKWLEGADLSNGIDYNEASIDPGRFSIEYAWLDDESPIEDCWDLATAAGGWFYADRYGLFHYDNIVNWLFRSSQGRIDRSTMGGFAQDYDDRDLASEVSVEYATRGAGYPTDLWKADEVINIAPGETRVVTAEYSKPCCRVAGVMYDAVSSGGVELHWNLDFVAAVYYAQRGVFTFRNTHATHAVELRNLRVMGTPLEGGPTGTSTYYENTGGWWAHIAPKVRNAGQSSVYIQGPTHAQYIATVLGTRIQKPSSKFTVRNYPGDPSLDLGDIFEVWDDRAMDVPIPAHLIGISWTYGQRRFMQTLTLADASDVYQYPPGPGRDGYFLMRKTTGSALGAGNNKLFY